MHSFIVAMIVLINISILCAFPSPLMHQDDDLQDYNDETEFRHLAKRFQVSPWIHKRNPALCDFRLQSRPMPLQSALCAYGQNKEEVGLQMNPFKYG